MAQGWRAPPLDAAPSAAYLRAAGEIPLPLAVSGNSTRDSVTAAPSSRRGRRRDRTSATNLPVAPMNAKQRATYNYLIGRRSGAYLVTGHAGTGKTYLALQIIQHLANNNLKVQVLCPTHQAKHQFSTKLRRGQQNIDVHTVAKYLAQFPVRSFTGENVFMRGGYADTAHHVILVDEASMVSEYEMGELLKARQTKLVIFLGDYAQLRPVMKKQGTLYETLKTFVLTEQQRNANRILKLCSAAREQVVYPNSTRDGIVVHHSQARLLRCFIDTITAADRPYDVCYLAYRNRTVDRVRALVHEALYGNEPFVLGQFIRLDMPAKIGPNGSIVKVVKVEERRRRKIGDRYVEVFRLRLRNMQTRQYVTEQMVAPAHQAKLKARLEELYVLSGNTFKKDKAAWEHYQGLIDDIKMNVVFHSSPFAQTVHKAQGRSIPTVFVDTQDISTGSDKKKLLYVGYSRAMHRLHTVRILRR